MQRSARRVRPSSTSLASWIMRHATGVGHQRGRLGVRRAASRRPARCGPRRSRPGWWRRARSARPAARPGRRSAACSPSGGAAARRLPSGPLARLVPERGQRVVARAPTRAAARAPVPTSGEQADRGGRSAEHGPARDGRGSVGRAHDRAMIAGRPPVGGAPGAQNRQVPPARPAAPTTPPAWGGLSLDGRDGPGTRVSSRARSDRIGDARPIRAALIPVTAGETARRPGTGREGGTQHRMDACQSGCGRHRKCNAGAMFRPMTSVTGPRSGDTDPRSGPRTGSGPRQTAGPRLGRRGWDSNPRTGLPPSPP